MEVIGIVKDKMKDLVMFFESTTIGRGRRIEKRRRGKGKGKEHTRDL